MTLDTDHMEKVSHHFGFFYEFWNGYFVKTTLDTGHKEKVSHHFGFFYESFNGYFVKTTLNTALVTNVLFIFLSYQANLKAL